MNHRSLRAAHRPWATSSPSEESPLTASRADLYGGLPIVSRRHFVGAAAGTVAAVAGFGSVLAACGRADSDRLTGPISRRESREESPDGAASAPVPVNGSPLFGGLHVWAPGPPSLGADPIDAEPISITDFKGFVGLAYVDGMVTRHNRKTGETRALPFIGADMRFMKGIYRGVDQQLRRATFGFI